MEIDTNKINFVILLFRNSIIFLIRAYQRLASPDHSFWSKWFFPYGYCKFTPSCSQYGIDVVKKRGILVGVPLLIWRILRCNPWSKGGEDGVL